MEIIRDGKPIELTFEEIVKIHDEYDIMCKIEDIRLKAKENNIILHKDDTYGIIKIFDKLLSDNDNYWDTYWYAIENAIKEYIKRKGR